MYSTKSQTPLLWNIFPPKGNEMKGVIRKFLRFFLIGRAKKNIPLLSDKSQKPIARFITMAVTDRPEGVYSRKSGIQIS